MKPEIIKGDCAIDDRGSLTFVNDFDLSGIKRFYQVENHTLHTIRAWHGHRHESKFVYVPKGTALVGAVDLETEAIHKFYLSPRKPGILHIPPNHANGFMNLEPDTIMIFYSTATLEESLADDIRYPYDRWNIWKIEYR